MQHRGAGVVAGESTTFDAVLNGVRTDLAMRLLQNRDASLAEAADLLGFSSGSAFSRWFLGAFGQRPSDWRKDFGAGATQAEATKADATRASA